MNISSDDPLPRRGQEPFGSGYFDEIEAGRASASGFGDAPQQVRDSFRESLVQLALPFIHAFAFKTAHIQIESVIGLLRE